MELLSKIDLHALKTKHNVKTEFGIKRINSFIALQGKGGCSRLTPSKTVSLPGGRDWEFYREITELTGFNRNYMCYKSH